MKETGIIRPIDDLGRVVLPMEIRKNLALNPKDGVEIYTDKDCVVLRKHMPNCIFCGSVDELISYRDKPVCSACLGELRLK